MVNQSKDAPYEKKKGYAHRLKQKQKQQQRQQQMYSVKKKIEPTHRRYALTVRFMRKYNKKHILKEKKQHINGGVDSCCYCNYTTRQNGMATSVCIHHNTGEEHVI